MAKLIDCKDCGHQVSKKARVCPQCGAPIKAKGNFGCLSVIVLSFLVIWAVGSLNDTSPTTRQVRTAPPPAPPQSGEAYWVTSDRLNRRTCPSENCGAVGWLLFREKATVQEVRDGWGRVSKYYQASCENGVSRFVDSGNSSCTEGNGIVDGRLAEWVSMRYLSRERPADPAAGATSNAALVAQSDDYRVHKDAFIKAASELIQSGRCTAKDFTDNGGWVKSTAQPNKPVYFMYCGGFTNANRLYLNATTGEVYR